MLMFAKFIGANTDFATAQAYLFPRVPLENSEEPVFGLVIRAEGEDIFVYVRQHILHLEEQFSAPFERISDKLHQLGELISLQLTRAENLQFTLFCAKDNTFYVFQSGENYVQLLRDGKAAAVFSDDNLQQKVISGFIKNSDRILVLSARSGSTNWNNEVLEQTLTLKEEEIDDAQSIFATDELKEQEEEDFAGVKNIEPVAFILIDNQTQEEDFAGSDLTADLGTVIPKPRINFKIKLPEFNPWIFAHKLFRRFFGLFRRVNRKILLALIILILISAVSTGGYLFWRGKNASQNVRFNNLITAVETSLNEATILKDSDSKQASEKITQAKARLSEAESLEKDNPEIKELKDKLDQKQAEVLRIYKNFTPELFMSLNLIKENFKAVKMSFSVGKLLLLDTDQKSLVAIDSELKTPSILAGPQQFGNAQLASLNGSHAFVYAPDKGLTHIDIDTKKTSSVASVDPEWGEVADIFAFSSNIYVLDKGKSKIWKYAPTESGYSGKLEYLRSEANLGLSKKLVIDYSVWVLTSEPDILKFTAGNSDYYAAANLTEPLTQIDNIFVPEELDSVFILDKSTNRILVTKKNGEYLAQYINDQFSKVDDFFVDEENKKIYLLIENKIYTTPLR